MRVCRVGREYVFANPGHDFPQRIGHALLADDGTLHARVDGPSGPSSGSSETLTIDYRPFDCTRLWSPSPD